MSHVSRRLSAGLAALAATTALVTGATQSGAPASAAPAATLSTQDLSWMAFAARANLSEVALGKLAVRHSQSPQVRAFGRDMIKDHGQQLAALQASAATLGVTLPTRPDSEQRHLARLWSHVQGRAFDCAYVPFQWDDHQGVIDRTAIEVTLGSDPTARQAAAASLPVLQEHLSHATMLLHRLRSC